MLSGRSRAASTIANKTFLTARKEDNINELAHHFQAAAASKLSPMRRFMGFDRKKNDVVNRKKLSVNALRAYSMSKCLPDCKLPTNELQTTIDHAQEVFNEVQMLSESKILKAKGFNRAYEMGLRVQRMIEGA